MEKIRLKNQGVRVLVLVLVFAFVIQAWTLNTEVNAETHPSSDFSIFENTSINSTNNLNNLKTGTRNYDAVLSHIDSDRETTIKNDTFSSFWRNDEAFYTVEVDEEGYYNLLTSFYPDAESFSNLDISVEINGEIQFDKAQNIRIHTEWTDDGEISVDRYGNEVVPTQKMIYKNYSIKLIDHEGDYAYPFVFYFTKGVNEIKITNNRTLFFIDKQITLTPIQEVITYSQYIEQYKNERIIDHFEMYEAQVTHSRNKASILPEAARDPSMTPYDSRHLKLNFISGENFGTAGERVNWEINVPETGLYYITFKTRQMINELVYAPAFRTISINGEIPFKELSSYKIDYSRRWQNHTLSDSDGEPFLIYLTEGSNILSMTIDNSPFTELLALFQQMVNEINDLSLDIRKMTGNIVDRNREWDLSEYLPDVQLTLDDWVDKLQKSYDYLLSLSHSSAKYTTFTGIALQMMTNIARDPDDLPNQLSALSTGANSIFAQLSLIITFIEFQSMAIDVFYIHGENNELPNPEVSFFVRLMESILRFLRTFTDQEYSLESGDGDEVNVWVNKGRSYVTLLQQMIDTDFTPKTGIKVNLSIMPDEKKMILGNASGTNPDMVIGASTTYPYELAMRGAAADLSVMDGFFTLAQTVQPGAFISYMVDESVYAIPETQDFWVMFYRNDILSSLNLKVPETWGEVIDMLPTLQRYGMNFATNIAGFESMRPLQATMPYIYQHGGSVVSDDGMTTAIDEENSLQGIKFMTDLFNIYSTPERVANLYMSMQRGEIPIGISNFGTYMTLSFAASDMTGKWDIAVLPGVIDENGDINRQAPGAAQCSIIFENSDMKEEAWELLKWYASTETQILYGNRLYMTFGEGFILNTANTEAFEHMHMPEEHKEVILEQWESLVELPRVPGYYMIERELSNVWNKVVIDGALLREAVDDSAIIINREIARKMEEFKYIVDGELVREYNVPTLEKITAWLEQGLKAEQGQ